MLSGFYPAFMIRNTDQEHSSFLQSLIETRWEMPEYAEYERVVCNENHGDIAVMAPFWAEFFDVATNVAPLHAPAPAPPPLPLPVYAKSSKDPWFTL